MEIIIVVEKEYGFLPNFLRQITVDVERGLHEFHFIAGSLIRKAFLAQIEAFCDRYNNTSLTLRKGLPNRYECANTGFAETSGNVIVVSPDVLPPDGWMKTLVDAASHQKGVATLTPISNTLNADTFVRSGCREDALLGGFEPQELGEIVSHTGCGKNKEVSFAHGNCRFISREAIDGIGGYDAAFFCSPTGYEADFAYRAQQAGFKNYLYDCLYVHTGNPETLFGSQKAIRDDEVLFFRRHSSVMDLSGARNAQYSVWSGINRRDLLDKVKNNDKKNVLYVSHYDFRYEAENHLGGIQLHVKDLVENLRKDINIFCAARDGDFLAITIYAEDRRTIIKYPISKQITYPQWSDSDIMSAFRTFMDKVYIDVIHVHSVVDLSFDIFEIAMERNIPLCVTLHDYYFICPTIKMLDDNGSVCELDGKNDCNACIKSAMGMTNGNAYTSLWRKKCAEYLEHARHIIAPSDFVKEMYGKVYPQLTCLIQVIEHGLTPFTRGESIKRYLKTEKMPMARESTELKFNIENYRILNRRSLIVDGWAFAPGQTGNEQEIGLVVSGGERVVFKKDMASMRKDVAEMFGESHLYSGFSLRIPIASFEMGTKVHLAPIVFTPDKIVAPAHQENGLLQLPTEDSFSQANNPMRIAFIGNIDKLKGSGELLRIANELSADQFQFVVIGNVGDRELIEKCPNNIILAGKYTREELPAMLAFHEVDVVCVLSMLMETFCYTLSEAWWQGLPVICTDMGAQGQRMRQNRGGWVVSMNGAAQEVVDILLRLRKHPIEIAKMKQAVRKIRMKTAWEMAAEYGAIYSRY